MADLATLQRRFYTLVTAGEGVVEPGFLTGSARLHVYAEMYIARLVDVLVDDHPKLRAALCDDTFRELVADYLRARPPTSFTVRDAGAALADYCATRDDLPPWAADLARLERARVEVFDAPDANVLTSAELAQIPIEAFPEVALAFVPASALVTIAWTVDELWAAIEAGAPIAAPTSCERSVLAWRRDLRVVHRTLDADESELARRVAGGATIAEMSAALADLGPSHPEQRMVEILTRWLDGETLKGK